MRLRNPTGIFSLNAMSIPGDVDPATHTNGTAGHDYEPETDVAREMERQRRAVIGLRTQSPACSTK